MKILNKLKERWQSIDYPFLIHSTGELCFSEIAEQEFLDMSDIKKGDVVALIGDFDPKSILTLLLLIDKNIILVPLTKETQSQHEYFFKSALVDIVIEGNSVKRIEHEVKHEFVEKLRSKELEASEGQEISDKPKSDVHRTSMTSLDYSNSSENDSHKGSSSKSSSDLNSSVEVKGLLADFYFLLEFFDFSFYVNLFLNSSTFYAK